MNIRATLSGTNQVDLMSGKFKEHALEYDLVFIIDCTSNEERGRFQVSKDLMTFLAIHGINHVASICTNKNLLLETLQHIRKLAHWGNRICLHFVSQSCEKGLRFKFGNDIIYWDDLKKQLQDINELLSGKLLVNMVSSAGVEDIYEDQERLPTFRLLSNSKELKVSQVKEVNELFYRKHLLEKKKINEALGEMKKELCIAHLFCIQPIGFRLNNRMVIYN